VGWMQAHEVRRLSEGVARAKEGHVLPSADG